MTDNATHRRSSVAPRELIILHWDRRVATIENERVGGLEMRLAFLTPARVNIIYISTDGCQKPLALIFQWFQSFIFDTPIYSISTHTYTIYRLPISLYCSIHLSHAYTYHISLGLLALVRHTSYTLPYFASHTCTQCL